jgi:plastocyanin domain-containing protein
MRTLILLGLLVVAACSKEAGSGKDQGTVGADGIRRIDVEAGKRGYDPAKISARPGEQLILVFKRTAPGECLEQVQVGDGPLIDLPMDTKVEIPVTAPSSGTIAFVCGMDGMQRGVIAVN